MTELLSTDIRYKGCLLLYYYFIISFRSSLQWISCHWKVESKRNAIVNQHIDHDIKAKKEENWIDNLLFRTVHRMGFLAKSNNHWLQCAVCAATQWLFNRWLQTCSSLSVCVPIKLKRSRLLCCIDLTLLAKWWMQSVQSSIVVAGLAHAFEAFKINNNTQFIAAHFG